MRVQRACWHPGGVLASTRAIVATSVFACHHWTAALFTLVACDRQRCSPHAYATCTTKQRMSGERRVSARYLVESTQLLCVQMWLQRWLRSCWRPLWCESCMMLSLCSKAEVQQLDMAAAASADGASRVAMHYIAWPSSAARRLNAVGVV